MHTTHLGLRDRSLFTGRGEGGGYKMKRGASQVLPTKKGGGRKGLSDTEEGAQKITSTWELQVLAILKRGHKQFPPFKRWGGGGERIFPVLRVGGWGVGGCKTFLTRDFPIL